MIFRTVINVVRVLAVLASPIIPTSSATVLDALGAPEPRGPRPTPSPTSSPRCRPATPITVPPVLFAKVTDEQKAELEARFGGPDD